MKITNEFVVALLLIQLAIFAIHGMAYFHPADQLTSSATAVVQLNVEEEPGPEPPPEEPPGGGGGGPPGCVPDLVCSEWGPEPCPVSGIQARLCTDANGCQEPFTETRECEPEPRLRPTLNLTKTVPVITPDRPERVDFTEIDTAIYMLVVSVDGTVTNVSLTVARVFEKPPGIPDLPDIVKAVYVYEIIEMDFIPNSTGILFKVAREWLGSNSIRNAEMTIFRFDEGEWAWEQLTSGPEFQDERFVHYTAETDDTSLFAIAAIELPEDLVCDSFERRCEGLTVQECAADGMGWTDMEECGYACQDGRCVPAPAFPAEIVPIGGGLLLLLLFLLLLRRRKRKKRPAKRRLRR
jgi:PGF-pre-PGF domain-containing protein